jgi:cytosine/adenosine deaminase-related metal-dependent hydrolase
MTQRRILFKGAHILTMDDNAPDLPVGDLLVDGTRIAAIAPSIVDDQAEVVDASGCVLMPGFVDTHRHTWQTQLHGVRTDWNHLDYMTFIRSMYCVCYEAEDAELGNYLGALEALNSGITTMVDHSHLQISHAHSDGLARGFLQSGIRGIYCYGVYQNPSYKPGDKDLKLDRLIAEVTGPLTDWHRANALRVREQFFPSNDGLVQFGIACSELSRSRSVDAMLGEMAWSRTLEPARISLHVATNRKEPINVVQELARRKLLAPDILFVHGNHLKDEELRAIVDAGSTVSSAVEPEMTYGAYPVVSRLAEMGGTPSIGIDVTIDFSGDMFGQMRALLNTWRLEVTTRNPEKMIRKIHQRRVLEIATLLGARSLGLDTKIGSLIPGKEADLVMMRMDGIGLAPMNNPYPAVVTYGHPSEVDSVMVAGKFMKRDGKLVGVDWPALRQKISASRDRIMERFRQIPEAPIRQLWARSFNVEVVK